MTIDPSTYDKVESGFTDDSWKSAYRPTVRHPFAIREEHDGTFWAVAHHHGWHEPAAHKANSYSTTGPFSTLEEAVITASLLGLWR
jgi:hypothetical protein